MSDYLDYIGIPFESRGRTPAGADCWGLVRLVMMERHNIVLPAYDEPDARDCAAVREAMAAQTLTDEEFAKVPTAEAREGDILLLRIGGLPVHVGIAIDGERMLHCMERGNSVIERFTGDRWRRKILAVYRHRDLADE